MQKFFKRRVFAIACLLCTGELSGQLNGFDEYNPIPGQGECLAYTGDADCTGFEYDCVAQSNPTQGGVICGIYSDAEQVYYPLYEKGNTGYKVSYAGTPTWELCYVSALCISEAIPGGGYLCNPVSLESTFYQTVSINPGHPCTAMPDPNN